MGESMSRIQPQDLSYSDLLSYCAHFVDEDAGMPIEFQRELVMRLLRVQAAFATQTRYRHPLTPPSEPQQLRLFP